MSRVKTPLAGIYLEIGVLRVVGGGVVVVAMILAGVALAMGSWNAMGMCFDYALYGVLPRGRGNRTTDRLETGMVQLLWS